MLQLVEVGKKFTPESLCIGITIESLSLSFPPESFTMIAGSGRSGKTTLRQLINGSLPPDTGRIYLDGQDITDWPENRRARYIGQVFANPAQGTIPELTVMENLRLARRYHWYSGWRCHGSRPEKLELSRELELAGLDLVSRKDRPVAELSSGRRQLLSLLMAADAGRRLLLLDDHTAMLDPLEAEAVLRLTLDLIARHRLTAIMTTASLAQAIRLGNRLLLMHHGRVILDSSGIQKKKLHSENLLERLQEERRLDCVDINVAAVLEKNYI